MIVEHKKSRFKQWNCGSCTKLLGIIYNNGTLAIKFKDLMIWVHGECKTICRNCQTENIYKSNGSIEDI